METFPEKMTKIGVSIIYSIPHCPIDYFILFCCLDDILTPHILSMGQWNTYDDRYSDFGHFYEKKSLKNVVTSVHSPGFVRRTVWNTNDDRYSDFGHFI